MHIRSVIMPSVRSGGLDEHPAAAELIMTEVADWLLLTVMFLS